MRLLNIGRTVRHRWKWALVLGLLALAMCWAAMLGYRVVRWKAYIWLPSYLSAKENDEPIADDRKHLIFLILVELRLLMQNLDMTNVCGS